jgi:asparagine synthase (glutamine-hydrolysing)
MCGIAGVVAFGDRSRSEDSACVDRMMKMMRHRGPDQKGMWQAQNADVTLGHVRLSIVDLSENGRQPMTSASGRYTLVFNGEIYNHSALRLHISTYPFRGHSDTEVLLGMIEDVGIDATLARAAGMFSIALFDRETHELTLARDRAGEKPLFWALAHKRLIFSSEMRAILASGWLTPSIDDSAVATYLTLGYQPTTKTVIENIVALRPASILTLSCRGSPPTERNVFDGVRRYWQFSPHGADDKASDSATARVGETLKSVIPEYLSADVPVGVLLSGGLDSSIVALAAHRTRKEPLRTYTATFPGTEHDEESYARAVSTHINANQQTVPLTDDTMSRAAQALIPKMDFPIANPSYVPLTLVCEAARADVTVCLSGDGGDEVFGGYNRYRRTWQLWNAQRWIPYRLRRQIARSIGRRNASDRVLAHGWVANTLRKHLGTVIQPKLYAASKVLLSQNLEQAYLRVMDTGIPDEFRDFTHVAAGISEPPLNEAEFLDFVRIHDFDNYLPGDNLAKADQASMRVSLELRLPLLDRRIMDIGMSLSLPELRKGDTTKWPIAASLRHELGEAFIKRPKMGFSVPLETWLSGALGEWAKAVLMDKGSVIRDMLGAELLSDLWSDMSAGYTQSARFLWAATVLQSWWSEVSNARLAQ